MQTSKVFPLAGKRIFVAGHRGLVGSAVVRRLSREDCAVLTAGRTELDLLSQAATLAYLERERPDAVVVAAAKVGGIHANRSQPAEFLYQNLMIEANLIHGAYLAGVKRLLFLGSNCVYPRLAPQPISEDSLLTGPFEPTNEWYAIAKIAGIKLCQAFRIEHGLDYVSAMPANLYGPGDNFDLEKSHVLPALLRKAHEAKQAGARQFTVWGSGRPRREFMHNDDLADALVFLLERFSGGPPVNVGMGSDMSIRELAETVARVIGLDAELVFDTSMPDGTPGKLMDTQCLTALGWKPKIGLEEGIGQTYAWYLEQLARSADMRL